MTQNPCLGHNLKQIKGRPQTGENRQAAVNKTDHVPSVLLGAYQPAVFKNLDGLADFPLADAGVPGDLGDEPSALGGSGQIIHNFKFGCFQHIPYRSYTETYVSYRKQYKNIILRDGNQGENFND